MVLSVGSAVVITVASSNLVVVNVTVLSDVIVVVSDTVIESVLLSSDESNLELLIGKVFQVKALVNWLLGVLLGFLVAVVVCGMDVKISLVIILGLVSV